ncbi:MAG: HNH endonuclease, partial [Thermodesulfobacteriota bacterium]
VIQLINKEHFIYRLIPERNFILKTKELQESFDNSETEEEASEKITTLAAWTDLDKRKILLSEYHRLVNTIPIQERRYVKKHSNQAREAIAYNLRLILGDIYQGHCQVCDFWFLKKDNKPYFETHHINPFHGNNPKNLVLVCANCHRQFEYADVRHDFNDEGWLLKVYFNDRIYFLNQIVLKTKLEDSFKELFV